MPEQFFRQPSVMSAQQHFSQVPAAMIQRSRFNRSHSLKTTFDAGQLIPVYVDEVLPGDTFTMDATAFVRLATPLKPIMDNIYLDVHFWFVPYRLVWDNWQRFCGERTNPTDDPDLYTVPQANLMFDQVNSNTLASYLGVPVRTGAPAINIQVSALPFRAYYTIWNEWYRDQNLQNSVLVSTGNGPDLGYNANIPYPRGKRHDYFTSALPWPQKGDPVTIPLGTTAPVNPLGQYTGVGGDWAPSFAVQGDVTQRTLIKGANPGVNDVYMTGSEVANASQFLWNKPNLVADLAAATAITINDLRQAFQIQKLLERDARGGTRYIEILLSHFGVKSDDARLFRPEYLGGGTSRINVNPIASTAAVTDVPQANLSGVGTGVNRAGFTKSFTEHGVILGLVSARADLTYQQGLERFWSRKTRYDFYWPSLAHLGEQAVLNKEIYLQATAADDQVFGYQERYAEYRYKPSKISGKFLSDDPASLDVWHLSQDFATLPALNAQFIQDAPPIDRILAVPSEPHFLADFWFDLNCQRPMPVYSIPGLMDHF